MDRREESVGVIYYCKLSGHGTHDEGVCWIKGAWLGKREGSGMDIKIDEYWSLTCSRK